MYFVLPHRLPSILSTSISSIFCPLNSRSYYPSKWYALKSWDKKCKSNYKKSTWMETKHETKKCIYIIQSPDIIMSPFYNRIKNISWNRSRRVGTNPKSFEELLIWENHIIRMILHTLSKNKECLSDHEGASCAMVTNNRSEWIMVTLTVSMTKAFHWTHECFLILIIHGDRKKMNSPYLPLTNTNLFMF